MRQFCLVTALLVASAGLGAAQAPDDSSRTYSGVGSGHYIRTVSDDGQFVTLEDASKWEIDPRVRFMSKQWQPDAGISVRRAAPDHGFTYELDNLDEDEGVLARFLPR